MGYESLVGPGSNFAGVDQGIDFTPTGGGFDIYAPASGAITLADQTGHHFNRTSGQAMIILQLDQPPNAPNSSSFIYFCELIDINPAVHVGVHVAKGDLLGHCSQSPGIEVGWGRDATNGFLCGSGIPTPCGTSFNNWIQGLPAAPGGSSPSGGAPASGDPNYNINFNDPVSSINDQAGYDPAMGPLNNLPIMMARVIGPTDLAVNGPTTKAGPGKLLVGSMKCVSPPHFMVYFMWNPESIAYTYAFANSAIPIADVAPGLDKTAAVLMNQTIQFQLLFDRVYEVGYFSPNGSAPSLQFSGPSPGSGWNNDPGANSPFTKGVMYDIRAVERCLGIYDNTAPSSQVAAPNTTPRPGQLLQDASGGSTSGVPMGNAVDVALGSMFAPIFRGYFTMVEATMTRFTSKMVPVRAEVTIQVARLNLPDPQDIRVSPGFDPYESTPTTY